MTQANRFSNSAMVAFSPWYVLPRIASVARRAVDDFLERRAVEKAAEIVDEQARDEAVALRVRAADMRQHDDALGSPERVLGGQRLLGEAVEHRARDLLGFRGGDQVVVLDQVAAAEIQQPRAGLH